MRFFLSRLGGKIRYGVSFDNSLRLSNHFCYGAFFPCTFFSRDGKFVLYHNSGFYSCYSLLLQGIMHYTHLGLRVDQLDTTYAFRHFKDVHHEFDEICNDFWMPIRYRDFSVAGFFHQVSIRQMCHAAYCTLPFSQLHLLFETYFLPSHTIQAKMQFFTEKYSFDPENILAVVYRGTDKDTELTIAPPEDYIDITKKLLQKNPHLRILIQTDQAQVRKLFCDTFGDTCFYIEELPVTESHTVMHSIIKENKLDWALNFDAAIRLISQSKILINHTGNVALFLALYRGHAENMYQFDQYGRLMALSFEEF